jgi:hypothetical protein
MNPAGLPPANPYATPRSSGEGRLPAASAPPLSPQPPFNPEHQAGAGMAGLAPNPSKTSAKGMGSLLMSGGKAANKFLARMTHTVVKSGQRVLEGSASRTLSKLEAAQAQVSVLKAALAAAEAAAQPFQDAADRDHTAYREAKQTSDYLTKNTPLNPNGTLQLDVQTAQEETKRCAALATVSAEAVKGPNKAVSQAKNALRLNNVSIASLQAGHKTSTGLVGKVFKPLADKTPSQRATQVVHNVKELARLDAMRHIQHTVANATPLHPAPVLVGNSGEPVAHLLEHYSGLRHTEIWTNAEIAATTEITYRQNAVYNAANDYDEGITEANALGEALNHPSERQLLVQSHAARISDELLKAAMAAQQGQYVTLTSAGAGASGV